IREIPENGAVTRLLELMQANAPTVGQPQRAHARDRYLGALQGLLYLGGPSVNHEQFADAVVSSLDQPLRRMLIASVGRLNQESGQALAHVVTNSLIQGDLSLEQRLEMVELLTAPAQFVTPSDMERLNNTNLNDIRHGQMEDALSLLSVALLRS